MIENNPISSLSSKPADELQPAEKKVRTAEQHAVEKKHDRVEVSDQARLLSRANTALNNSSEIEDERVERVTRQVQDGTYQVQVNKLASILLERLYTNNK